MAEPKHATPDHKRAAPSHAVARAPEANLSAPELQSEPPTGDATARHVSLLADRRLSGEVSQGQRVRLLQRLQHGYGNGHVARVIQRVVDAPAPPTTHLEPDQDPKFHQVEGKIKQVGAKQKQHASPKAKAAEAQAAAHGPSNDVKSKAAAKQVGAMAAQEPGAFDRAAFIAAVKKSIAAKTPKNLEEADDFKESGKAGEVKGEVTGLVSKGKQDAERGIQDKTQAAPDTSGVQPKPVAPMGDEKAGPPPSDVGAKQAIPDQKSPAETSLDHGPAQVNDQMAQADVTEEQLQHSNEPTFQAAVDQKKQAEEHSRTAPAQFKAQEQQILAQASGQAAAEAQQQTAGMHRARAGAQSHVGSHKDAAKARDEARRAEVASKMEAIYSSTKTEVQAVLDALEGKVNAAFDKGEKVARDAFENHVDSRMRAYKKERYDGIRGKARWGWDKLTGMPSEVNAFYVEGRDLYLNKMETVIGEVADIVGKELTAAKARIARGRHDIEEYVASLPRDLQQVGKDAQKEIAGKFDQLESDVNEKQDSLVQSLAEKYCAARDAVDDRIKEMQAANKGLVDAVIDAVGGVIRTILQLKDMLLGVLRKAADVIGTIIKDPIGFLGNLVGAVKQGLNQFVANIGTHLEQGLMGWLFGAVGQAGIKLPDTFDLKGILSLVLQVLGLTYDNIRGIAVSLVGEKVVSGIEGTVKVLVTLVKEGPAGLWEWIKDKVAEIDIQGMVLGAIKDFVITRIITAGVTWLIGLLNPAAGFIKACKAIYDIIMFFIERGSQIMEFVNSVLDGIGAIAAGNISAAANLVENSLAKILPLAISFLASLLGLDGIGEKIKQIVEKIRAPITKLVTAVLTPILKPFKKLFDKGANFVKGVVDKGKALGAKAISSVKEKARAFGNKLRGKGEKEPSSPQPTSGTDKVKADALHEFSTRAKGIASIEDFAALRKDVLAKYRPQGLKTLTATVGEGDSPGIHVTATASPGMSTTVGWKEVFAAAYAEGDDEVTAELEEIRKKFEGTDENTPASERMAVWGVLSVDGRPVGDMRQNDEGGQHAEEFILAHDWDKGVAMARAVAKDRPEPIPVVISLSASPCSRCSAILSARLAATRAQLTHAERDRIQFSIAARGAYEKSERIKGAEAAADKQAEREKIIQGIKDSVVKRRNFLHKRLWLGKTLNEFLDIRSEEERLKTKISHPGMAQYRGQMLPKATSTKDSDLHKLMQSGFEVQVLAVREEITESGEQLEQAIVRVRAKFQQANAV